MVPSSSSAPVQWPASPLPESWSGRRSFQLPGRREMNAPRRRHHGTPSIGRPRRPRRSAALFFATGMPGGARITPLPPHGSSPIYLACAEHCADLPCRYRGEVRGGRRACALEPAPRRVKGGGQHDPRKSCCLLPLSWCAPGEKIATDGYQQQRLLRRGLWMPVQAESSWIGVGDGGATVNARHDRARCPEWRDTSCPHGRH